MGTVYKAHQNDPPRPRGCKPHNPPPELRAGGGWSYSGYRAVRTPRLRAPHKLHGYVLILHLTGTYFPSFIQQILASVCPALFWALSYSAGKPPRMDRKEIKQARDSRGHRVTTPDEDVGQKTMERSNVSLTPTPAGRLPTEGHQILMQ